MVEALSQRVAREVYLAPRNATIRITLRHIYRKRSRTGRSLSASHRAHDGRADAGQPGPASSRIVRPARKVLKAKVTADKLARAYPTVITIDRNNFKLRLFKRLKISKSYGVAVGQPAYPTPTGQFSIQNKQVNPAWTAPNSPWAGELAGTTTPGGVASNPLRARWMGIAGGVGIHGTSQEYSIGSRASHGCIRMRVADVIDLYPPGAARHPGPDPLARLGHPGPSAREPAHVRARCRGGRLWHVRRARRLGRATRRRVVRGDRRAAQGAPSARRLALLDAVEDEVAALHDLVERGGARPRRGRVSSFGELSGERARPARARQRR